MRFNCQQLRQLIEVDVRGRVFCSFRAYGIQSSTQLSVANTTETEQPALTEKAETDLSTKWRSEGVAMVDSRTMEAKLQIDRKPLQKLLREDCVHLGLVSKDRAEVLVRSLAGRTREQAEPNIVAELRNKLHQQVREYIRRHKGGPWPSPKEQEELRLDVIATNHVHSLLTLARQILREREQWESKQKKGVMRSLLGGKLKLGLGRH